MSETPSLPPISSKLAMTPIKQFMSRKVVAASPTVTIRLAMEMMLNHKISGLVIVNANQNVLGIYSELDAMLQGSSQNLDAAIVYSKPAIMVLEKTPFRDVLVFLAQKRLKRFPVIDDQKMLSGIITRRDLMKAIFKDITNARA